MERWSRDWAAEGVSIDPEELSGPRRFGDLPRRWVVEWTFSWLSEQKDEQGLRALGCHERDADLRGYDAFDGEAFGSLMRIMRIFRRFRSRVLRSSH